MPAMTRARSGRLLLVVFAVVAMAVGILGYLCQRHLRGEVEADKIAELDAIADTKRDQILPWLAERRGDLRGLAETSLS